MKNNTKQYWKGLEELTKNPEFEKYADKEFAEHLPINEESEGDGTNRRDFLKVMGFGIAAASLAACEAPIRKAIPYLNKPVDIDPGVPNYYASTYLNGSDFASIVVKTREGRPIKIEGNKLSSLSGGGTTAQVQASVLSLYDKERLQNPELEGTSVTWAELDKAVGAKLSAVSGKIVLMSNSVFSPSTLATIEGLKTKFPNIEEVEYDQISFSGALSANEKSFGKRVIPSYDFSKANTIVSFDADFLGEWLNSSLFNKQFAQTRKLGPKKKTMSRLYSFESNLSLTGSNADYRTGIKPSQQGAYIANLYNAIARKFGASTVNAEKIENSANLMKAANDLLESKGKSLVVSGSNDPSVQGLVNAINSLLGNYGTTLNLDTPTYTRKGDDSKVINFVKDLNSGNVGAVIFFNCNPVYDHGQGKAIADGLRKTKFSISTSDRKDETASLVNAIAPDNHFLESWNDAEPVKGMFTLTQPTISNLFNTRQAQQSFLSWSGSESTYFDSVKENWKNTNFTAQSDESNFDVFWDKCLHDGVFEATPSEEEMSSGAIDISVEYKAQQSGSGDELVIYQNNSVGNGSQGNNPWLQEMPDPITKAVWDNYLTISSAKAEEIGLVLGDMQTKLVNFTANGQTVKIPAMVQPGQAKGTVGLAMGYGRSNGGKVANGVGQNAYPFISYKNGYQELAITQGVSIELTEEDYRVAQTQTHHTYMERSNVVQESTLAAYKKDATAGRAFPMISTYHGKEKPGNVSLWEGHKYPNHHWGMIVDMNSCTGCGACTVSCQAENNVPVVGKAEVLNRREMSWLRIDRYYSHDEKKVEDAGGFLSGLKEMENPSDNPEVTFQPMMCQQCNNAPCETVCPVAATTHSTEGINQMTYNRCIGTRYCANNCPYKVRRFNWFKYHDNSQFPENTSMNNDLGKMVLNPDVTVRARGVMEKCSFCVQRVQYGKLEAKKEGRRPVDGEITSACASACPAEALVFGDMKDPKSKISQMLRLEDGENGLEVKEERAYNMLEEINVKPNVWYLTKIRNKDEKNA
ncbi:MAG: MoCo/4Fe-4S cofactor protein with predicted Tat translocation signal [Cyclobacteriaceae bacterium]|jgi:molybdopterin-containing oxidoreductase family iron-sulfur binding subunit